MKIVDNTNKIHSTQSSESSIQHEIGKKVSLSKKLNHSPREKNSISVDKSAAETRNTLSARVNLAKRAKLGNKKYTVLNSNGMASKAILSKTRNTVAERKQRIIPRNLKLAKKPQIHRTYKSNVARLDKTNAKSSVASGVASAVGGIAAKPIVALKDRAIRADKENGDTGIEGAKMGLRGVDKALGEARKIKTSVNRAREIHSRIIRAKKSTKRSLKTAKQTTRGLKTTANAAKNANNIAKATAKAAKTAAKAAKAGAKAAKAGAKVAAKVIKATVQVVKQVVSLIAETAPYSLIVIAIIVVLIVLYLLITMLTSSISGSVTGAGGWAITESTATPEDIYKEVEKLMKDAGKVLDNNVQKPLKREVDNACKSDTTKPRLIIQYKSNSHDVTYFPAYDHNTIIDSYIDAFDDRFDTEFYSNFLAVEFVLMTRDKQKADGVPDNTIYDFDLKKSDIEELIGKINTNSCKYGETYVFKKTETIHDCTCPDANCERKTIPSCRCCSGTNSLGHTYYYCGGHPYCPNNHDKLVVSLYTIEEYHNSDVQTIYKFTDNEMARFRSTKTFIQGLIDSYGGSP